jgi:hypothetical protein
MRAENNLFLGQPWGQNVDKLAPVTNPACIKVYWSFRATIFSADPKNNPTKAGNL